MSTRLSNWFELLITHFEDETNAPPLLLEAFIGVPGSGGVIDCKKRNLQNIWMPSPSWSWVPRYGSDYSVSSLRKPHSSLILNGERGFLRVNRLYMRDSTNCMCRKYILHSPLKRDLSIEYNALNAVIYFGCDLMFTHALIPAGAWRESWT